MNKTKIICTLGPSSEDKETFIKLVKAGLSVARINLSHATKEAIKERMDMIKEVREELNVPVAVLVDTKGPEIRTKTFVDGRAELIEGETVTLYYGEEQGNAERFCINYPYLHEDVNPGQVILVDDGLIELIVKEVNGPDIVCTIKNGGMVKNRKGVNVPNIDLSLPILTEDDEANIIYGVEQGVDFVAASFIRNAIDVQYVRDLLNQHGGEHVSIISKIESQQGVDNIDEIIEASEGIMIARGDLGVETPAELIPLTQKTIIKKCNQKDVLVITATQMLDSMMNNPRATRAEVSDVANAVLDGTDAIMLSGETAAGKYPVEAVTLMKKIAKAAEKTIDYDALFSKIMSSKVTSVTNAVSYASCSTAKQLDAAAIICPTYSGRTARLMSKFKPQSPIIATTSDERAQRQMMMYWGVQPLMVQQETSSDILFYKSVLRAKELEYVKTGDKVVITAGVPLGVAGNTNLMKIQTVD